MKSKTEELLERAKSGQNTEKSDSSVNGESRDFENREKAGEFFQKLKQKLFDLRAWNTESALSSYAQFDENGAPVEGRPLSKNDFIRISLKGTVKYDWVKVAEIHQTPQEIVIAVRPTFDPTGENPDKNATSHFFTSEATNNFCLLRDDSSVSFYVIGLDEKTNLSETGNILETARNAAVANLGSYLGVQSGEWKTFCRNFLEIETDK